MPDELLREDIAAAVDGDVSRRIASANELAERIEKLEARQQKRVQQRNEELRLQQERQRQNQRAQLLKLALAVAALALLLVFSIRQSLELQLFDWRVRLAARSAPPQRPIPTCRSASATPRADTLSIPPPVLWCSSRARRFRLRVSARHLPVC